MSIKVDNRVYENVSLKYDEEEYPVLVTYTEDGEFSYLYAPLGCPNEDIAHFLADTRGGTIEMVKLWRLHDELK